MTLLDYYTAGTVEYFTLLFAIVFGVLGLYFLAGGENYRKHVRLLSGVYAILSVITGWVIARLIGTTVLIYVELNASGYWNTYATQASQYDPAGITRWVPVVMNSPFYPLVYYGVPTALVLFMLWMWYRLVWTESKTNATRSQKGKTA